MTIPKSLDSLEQLRTSITNQIAALGDLRCGSITSTTGRCGKPNCHCHQPKDPGHGPNLRVTFKVNGKTVTQSLPNQSATRKVEREIAEFRKLQSLHKELIEVNAQICQTASIRTGCAFAGGKKTADTIRQEVTREVDQLLRVIFNGRRKTGRLDLEAIEMAVRSALHRAGAAALTELLRFAEPTADQRTLPLSLRLSGQLSGNALQEHPHCRRPSSSLAVRTTCAPTVTTASSPPTSNWTSNTRSSLRECAACRPSWARRPLSIMAGSN